MDIDLYKEHYLDPEKSSAVVEWTQNISVSRCQ
jgi:hypothetical protein